MLEDLSISWPIRMEYCTEVPQQHKLLILHLFYFSLYWSQQCKEMCYNNLFFSSYSLLHIPWCIWNIYFLADKQPPVRKNNFECQKEISPCYLMVVKVNSSQQQCLGNQVQCNVWREWATRQHTCGGTGHWEAPIFLSVSMKTHSWEVAFPTKMSKLHKEV